MFSVVLNKKGNHKVQSSQFKVQCKNMIDEFKTISDTVGEGYYTEKRSKFLAFAHHVTTVDEVKEIVAGYRKKYYDARHCCYAYMLGP